MLRIGFLPSDYNPMVLMLGEAEDLRLLAGVLRRFAHEQTELRLDQLTFCTASRTKLTLTASPGALGIQPLARNDFAWRLDPNVPARSPNRSASSRFPTGRLDRKCCNARPRRKSR